MAQIIIILLCHLMSILRMAARLFGLFITLYMLSGCVISSTDNILKIALLAPFEGQYRDIGYEALYAARLALSDADLPHIDLLAIDDGGSVETAILRAEAIRQDPAIRGVLILGIHAANRNTQLALGEIPTLIIGHWNTTPAQESVFLLTNPAIDILLTFTDEITALTSQTQTTPLIGSDLLSLAQVPQLIDVNMVEFYSSSDLPSDVFRDRYLNSAEFVPEPRLIAPLTFDAMTIMLTVIIGDISLDAINHEGITGTIRFDNGYWVDAPLYHFRYEDDLIIKIP